MHDISSMTPDELRKLADEIEAHNERKRLNDAAGWIKIFEPRPPPFDFSTMSAEDIRGLLTSIEQVAAIR
jgi:hypothetical protein